MTAMFYECESLINLNLSSFNTNNVTNMCGMFGGCYKLIYVKINKNNNQKLLYELNYNVKIEE